MSPKDDRTKPIETLNQEVKYSSEKGGKKPYVRPEIVWEEEYRPAAFGVSCAKQPGNPGCNPGPFTN